MLQFRNTVLPLLTVIASSVGVASAAPIVSQPFVDAGTETVDQFSDPLLDEIGADNFTPTDTVSSGTLLQLNWWGTYTNGTSTISPPAGATDFTVRFYSDDGGSPGIPDTFQDGEFTVSATRDAFATDGVVFGFSLDSPFTLNFDLTQDVTYWISIAEADIDTGGIAFQWREGTVDSGISETDIAFSGDNGATWANPGTFTTSYLAFELSTIDTAVVPEPTSLALLGMGAMGFMGYGWRRRKHRSESAEV